MSAIDALFNRFAAAAASRNAYSLPCASTYAHALSAPVEGCALYGVLAFA